MSLILLRPSLPLYTFKLALLIRWRTLLVVVEGFASWPLDRK